MVSDRYLVLAILTPLIWTKLLCNPQTLSFISQLQSFHRCCPYPHLTPFLKDILFYYVLMWPLRLQSWQHLCFDHCLIFHLGIHFGSVEMTQCFTAAAQVSKGSSGTEAALSTRDRSSASCCFHCRAFQVQRV